MRLTRGAGGRVAGAGRRAVALAGVAAVALVGCDLGEPAGRYVVAPPGVTSVGVAAGDVDGDGDADLVTGSARGYAVARNDGTGAMAVTQVTPADVAGGPEALGDLDGDGAADLAHGVTGGAGAGGVAVRLADGDGGFAATATVLDSPGGMLFVGPVLADLDADGGPDVLAAAGDDWMGYGMQLVWWANDGDGTFAPAAPVDTSVPVEPPISDVAIADVNDDGRPDLVLAIYFEAIREVGVAFGTGDGGFGEIGRYSTGLHELDSTVRLQVADVDGDGSLDVVGTNGRPPAWGPNVFALLNDGDGAFGDPLVTTAPGDATTSVSAADVDGDGHLDVATDGGVLFGAGDGTFPRSREVAGGPRSVAVDVDADGAVDLAYVVRDRLVVMRNALGDG